MLSSIRVPYKLLLIYFLDMIAVVYLGYTMASEQMIAINFAKKELVGNSYLSSCRQTLLDAYRLDDALAWLPAEREARLKALTADADALAAAERDNGADMDSAALAQQAVASVRAAVANASHASIGDATQAIRALISRVGDSSNLILDPDLDSYYAMSIVLLRFPELTDTLFVIAEQERRMEAAGSLSAQEKNALLMLIGRLKTAAEGTASDLAAGIRGNSDGGLSRALTPPFQQLAKGLDDLNRALDVPPDEALTADKLAAMRQSLLALPSLVEQAWQHSAEELDRLIKVRVDGFWYRMREHFALAALLLGIILTMVVTVARSIADPVKHLAGVADEVRRTSNFSLRATVRGTDEFGRLAEAFNTMLDRLQLDAEREQELAARARAAEAQEALVDRIPAPLVVTRRSDDVILRVNRAAAELVGEGKDRQLRSVSELFPPDARARLNAQLSRDGLVDEFETECRPLDGEPFPALVSARPLTFQDEDAVLTVITSIGELRRAQANLVRGGKAGVAGRAGRRRGA